MARMLLMRSPGLTQNFHRSPYKVPKDLDLINTSLSGFRLNEVHLEDPPAPLNQGGKG